MIRVHLSRWLLLGALAPRGGQSATVMAASLTFTVNSTADAPDTNPGDGICVDAAGQCTLRAAIQEADAQPSGSSSTIDVPAGTYGLTLGTLLLTANNINISGALSSTTIISGSNTNRIMAISPTVQASLSQLTITGGNAGTGKGGGIINAGLTVLSRSVVMSNTATRGGGILNGPTGRLRLDGSTLSGNAANAVTGRGGGIENSGLLTVTSSTLSNNTAGTGRYSDSGGGIDNGGTLSVTASTFSGNVATAGGGIASSGMLTVTNSTFNGNSATCCYGNGGNGAGIYNVGLATVRSSTFSGNYAVEDGGGIDNRIGTLSVTNSTFSNNTATGHFKRFNEGGGAIFNGSGGAGPATLTVSKSSLSGNTAPYGAGGGIDNDAFTTLTVTASTLSGNSAYYYGGGIYNENWGTLSMTMSTLSGNTSNGRGGGLYNNGSFGTALVGTSTISGNKASEGAGVYNVAPLTVTGSTLGSNAARSQGGGIFNENGPLTLSNSTLSGNTAPQTGGIYSDDGLLTLSYDTIASNSSGIDSANYTTIGLTGTIMANSTTGRNCSGLAVTDNGYNLDSGTSCGFSQTTDITNTDPVLGPLANNGGRTKTMALLPGSPAIDHGGASATGCPATDQRGMPRPDEAADNGACDMGAYESQGIG